MYDEATQPRFSYPGHDLSSVDGKTPIYEARVFIGNCLPGYDNAVIWHERVRIGRDAWEAGVFVLGVQDDVLRGMHLSDPIPAVSASLKQVAAGQCRELPGVDRLSER